MKRRRGIVTILCFMALLSGCASKSYEAKYNKADMDFSTEVTEDSYSFGSDISYEASEEPMSQEAGIGVGNNSMDTSNAVDSSDLLERKLIYTANVELATDKFEQVKNDVDQLIKKKLGYIGNSYLSNDEYYRSYVIEARVPQDKLDEFLNEITKLGSVAVRSMQQSSEDITLDYYDSTEIKHSLELERARIMDMIKDAESLDNLIILEDKLTQINQDIARFGRRIRSYDNQVNFSTVNLTLNEVKGEELVVEKTIGEKMGQGFMQSIRSIKNGFVNIAIVLVAGSPYLVLIGLIVVIIIVNMKRNKKKKNQSLADHNHNTDQIDK